MAPQNGHGCDREDEDVAGNLSGRIYTRDGSAREGDSGGGGGGGGGGGLGDDGPGDDSTRDDWTRESSARTYIARDDDGVRDGSGRNNSTYSLHNTHRYHDEPDDDEETIGSTASLLRASPNHLPYADRRMSTPSWQDQVSQPIPSGMQKTWAMIVDWVKGPKPPRIYRITPLFPKVQHAPITFLDRYAPRRLHRFCLLILLYGVWLFFFSLTLWKSSLTARIAGYGTPVRLSCEARYWGDGNLCGLDGDECRPFANASLAFRCPADCHKTLLVNPHAVGDQEVVYKPLVVGGPSELQTGYEGVILNNAVYRGDSFVCASAVHAGFIRNFEGGCGVVTLTGEQSSFPGSRRNNIESTAFPSYFPQSFGFLSGTKSECKDLRWPALAPSLIFTIVLSLFTTDPAVHFWSIFVVLFLHVALVSDPPANTTYDSLLSIALGRLLPACFCAWVTYRYTVKRSLTGLTAQFEKTILWVGAAWVGSLNNYTFDQIPIQRLTPHDIEAQPGAVPALIVVVLTIFFIALGQAWAFRVEGRMPRYLAIYSLMVASLLILLAVPSLNLRIHHYILALLLLPGTSFQNRPSLLYQGLLLGLFINGVARWGFASIVETPAALLRDAPQGTLLPAISVLAMELKNITFNLGTLPTVDPTFGVTYDGISVLVNDVERFHGFVGGRGYWDGAALAAHEDLVWSWSRHQVDPEATEYFRFAYMAGRKTADYTKAGVWDEAGGWTDMELGPS